MKKITNKLVGGMLLLSVSMSLTSCEDVLGHWEKPTPIPITPSGGTPVTPEEIIYAFSLRNMADADITATAFNVTDQDGNTIVTAESDGKYTIKSGELSSVTTLWLEANTATGKYIAKATVEELPAIAEAGKLKMATVGDVIKDDGKFYAAGTSGAVAMIAYLGNGSECDHGLAIALADESGKKKYGAAGTACSGKAAVTGGTWRLPSEKDWQYMFIGCGSSESYIAPNPGTSKSYSGLASKLTTAQGETLEASQYWSSTEFRPGIDAWTVNCVAGTAGFNYYDENFENLVRACLAF